MTYTTGTDPFFWRLSSTSNFVRISCLAVLISFMMLFISSCCLEVNVESSFRIFFNSFKTSEWESENKWKRKIHQKSKSNKNVFIIWMFLLFFIYSFVSLF
jgi:hypothetical protein